MNVIASGAGGVVGAGEVFGLHAVNITNQATTNNHTTLIRRNMLFS
jgi:hypothetical protein